MQSRLRQSQPARSNEYYTALLATGYYDPTLQNQEAHHKRQHARTLVARNDNLPLHIRQEALRDLQLHHQRTFTYSVVELSRDIKTSSQTIQYFTRFLEIKRKYRKISTKATSGYSCDHTLICFCT